MCEQVRGRGRVPAGQLLPRQLAQLALAVQGAVDIQILDDGELTLVLGDQAEHAEEALAKLNHSYIAHLWGSHSRGQGKSLDRVSQF